MQTEGTGDIGIHGADDDFLEGGDEVDPPDAAWVSVNILDEDVNERG